MSKHIVSTALPDDLPLKAAATRAKRVPGVAKGHCACGAVAVEIDTPAFWAWHDHCKATQRAHGAAYATFVGCWKSKVRVTKGRAKLRRYANKITGIARSFCEICGTPILYERPGAAKMVNLPRALFDGRTGREPRYHVAIEDAPEWAYRGEPLAPLKGYPGVMWTRRSKPTAQPNRA